MLVLIPIERLQLQRRQQEELAEYRNRLEKLQLTEAIIQSVSIGSARFDRGENELMFASLPSDLCTDGGRAIRQSTSQHRARFQMRRSGW